MKSNRTMKVKINKKHPRQSLKICRGYLFVFCVLNFCINGQSRTPVPTIRLANFLMRRSHYEVLFVLEVTAGFEPADNGVADRGLTTWLRHHKIWSGLRGSNPPPRPWQGRALPNELNPHFVVPPIGIEPTTRGFSVPCSTN